MATFSYNRLRAYEAQKHSGKPLCLLRHELQPLAPRVPRDKGLIFLAGWVPGSMEYEQRDVMVRLARNQWAYFGHYEFGPLEVFNSKEWAFQTKEVRAFRERTFTHIIFFFFLFSTSVCAHIWARKDVSLAFSFAYHSISIASHTQWLWMTGQQRYASGTRSGVSIPPVHGVSQLTSYTSSGAISRKSTLHYPDVIYLPVISHLRPVKSPCYQPESLSHSMGVLLDVDAL